MTRAAIVAVVVACGAATPGRGQVPVPVAVPGLGTLSFPTSTQVAAAQQAFLRGVLQLHVFEYSSALEAFREAERLDPTFAMAYWGEAMTYTHPVWDEQDVPGARAALERLGPSPAAREAKAATPRERGYLRAVDILYGDGTKARRDTLYSQAMGALSHAYPADDEARLFYALSLLGLSQSVRNIPTYLHAAAIAESVFARNPLHPGAAHYWIHGMDDPDHAALALPAARALSAIAPDAGHAQHMTSHIFMALGMWDDVVTANENAMRVVNATRGARGAAPAACGHYNAFLDYGYLQQGRVADARRLLAACRDQVRPGSTRPQDLDPDTYSFISMWSRYLLDTQDWSGQVASWDVDPGEAPAPRLSFWFTRAFGAARQADTTARRRAFAAFELARHDIAAIIAQSGVPPAPDQREFLMRAEVLRLELVGSIDGSLDTLRQAVALERGMAYAFGPPFVNEPADELLGTQLLAAHRPNEARRAFEAALARTPGRASVLLGLARAAAASGDRAAASRHYAALAAIWHAADPDLPDLKEVRAR
jgi:tetratricopeptide (TPR) repeat protein